MPKYVDHECRRREVAEVAAGLVAEEGRAALTVRRVAEAAGQSTTVVSHYFDDMGELLHATCSLAVRRSRARVDTVLGADPTDIVGLAEALLPLDATCEADWRIWLAFWGEAFGSPPLATSSGRGPGTRPTASTAASSSSTLTVGSRAGRPARPSGPARGADPRDRRRGRLRPREVDGWVQRAAIRSALVEMGVHLDLDGAPPPARS